MSTALLDATRAHDMAATLTVTCVRGTWRGVLGTLVVMSRLSVLLIFARVLFVGDPPMTPLLLVGAVLLMVLLPAALAALLTRTFAATLAVEGDALVVARRDVRFEIPRSAIVAVVPWRLPLPTPGASLMLRSGRGFGYGMGLARPRDLVAFLDQRAGAGAETERADAAFSYAEARADAGTLRWWHWLLEFPVFGLMPTAVLFNAHQHIAYGGTWGEYYLYGARAYLIDFGLHWITVTIYLGLWAGLWRVTAEIVAWLASRLAPQAIVGMRRVVEIGGRVFYYGGVPVVLALRFMS